MVWAILLTVLWIYLPMLLAAPTDVVALSFFSTHCFSAAPFCCWQTRLTKNPLWRGVSAESNAY
jgi:hypothetical protein